LRKKRVKQKKRDSEEEAAQHKTPIMDANQETIEVNWDEIDKRYEEIPTSKLTAPYPSPPIAPSSIAKYEEDSTAFSGSVRQHKDTSPLSHNSVIVSHRPNTIDELSHQPIILKPDGANA
jgi:hypothetical protein